MPTAPLEFRADPLGWIDALVATGRTSGWIAGEQLLVADAAAGRRVLWNADGLYEEHSDFFGGRSGALARPAQIEVGRRVRALLEARLAEVDLAQAAGRLGPRSTWPAAGNALMFDLLRPILIGKARSPRFVALVGRVAETRIYRRAPSWRMSPRRLLLRRAFHAAVEAERRSWRDRPPSDPADVLEVLLACAAEESAARLAEVYASVLFATVGSLGFALGWSLLLSVSHDALDVEPRHLVSEALRLFPIAWFLARRPRADHVLLGEAVTVRNAVIVSPYAIQRHPARWTAASEFHPERWRTIHDRSAWLPFGAGPHACLASALTLDLVGGLLAALRVRTPTIPSAGVRPQVAAALAPPQFVLALEPARGGAGGPSL